MKLKQQRNFDGNLLERERKLFIPAYPIDIPSIKDTSGDLTQQEKGVTLCQKGKHYKNPF